MMMQVLGRSRPSWLGVSICLVTLAALIVAAKAWATPPLGFVINEILASGSTVGRRINQNMQIFRNPDGTVTPWQLQLQVQGETDYYSQHLVLSPGGYSGWHSHPGLLIGTVASGQIDFYNDHCRKRTIETGQVFTENDDIHAISNTGAEDASLYISYLVKHGSPRRREESAPACAVDTGIP
jgi:quercetin dioxygenase-like cupin family protein